MREELREGIREEMRTETTREDLTEVVREQRKLIEELIESAQKREQLATANLYQSEIRLLLSVLPSFSR